MARIAGRNGRVYMAITSGGTASPLPFLSTWSIDFTVEKFDVTAMGDSNMVYVSGLPDAQGEFSGFYDDATAQTYTAAVDGIARPFYLYPSTLTVAQYWWGTILPDFKVNGGTGGPVEISASWNAASAIAKVG